MCWAAPFAKIVDVSKFVKSRGPAYGYNLNMKKSIYLMALERRCLSCQELLERINFLVNLGLPIDNIKVHPHIINCCQPSVSPVVLAKRSVQWGCKILGAFVGTDEYAIHELGNKMRKINNLTDVLIQYPKHQFRHCLHRLCYDSKVNY